MKASNDASQFLTLFLNWIQFYLRTKRFIIIFGITFAISLVVTLFYVLNKEQAIAQNVSASEFMYNFLGNIITIILLACALLGGDAISSDFYSKTGLYLLSFPIKRYLIILGRYFASIIAIIIIITVGYFIFAIILTYIIFEEIPSKISLSILFAIFFSLSVMSLAFLFSSIFKNPTVGIVVTLILLWVAFPSVQAIIEAFVKVEPIFFLTYGGEIIYAIIKEPYPSHKEVIKIPVDDQQIEIVDFTPSIETGLAIIFSYLIVCLILSILIYNRKEIK